MATIVVAHDMTPELRDLYATRLGGTSDIVYLAEQPPENREEVLSQADALVLWNPRLELGPDDLGRLRRLRFVQLITAGFDHVPFGLLPDDVPVASNAGAYSEPMAEHVVAMALAAAKRLPIEHAEMKAGRFNQFETNKRISGGICGVIGFGGIGKASARLFRCLGMRVHAVNRSGRTDETVDFVGTLDQLDQVLRDADIIVLSLPLTSATEGIIGKRELGLMREDAILVNVARGELVDQAALYDHLVGNPKFFACLEAWWVEPVRHGEFRLDYPFLDLSNVIASPHNSPAVPHIYRDVAVQACENLHRWTVGDTPWNIIDPRDRYR